VYWRIIWSAAPGRPFLCPCLGFDAVNGRRDGFTWADIKAAARVAGLKRGRAEEIAREVHAAVVRWPEFADTAGVVPAQRDAIFANLRLSKELLP